MANIKCVPAESNGVSAASSILAWYFGAWTEITSGLSTGIKVLGIQFQEGQNNPSVDTTMERLFEIGIGLVASETTKLQIPSSIRSDTTAYGHYMPPVNKVWLPEPYVIPASTRIVVRVADSTTTAVTYNGIKLIYEETGSDVNVNASALTAVFSQPLCQENTAPTVALTSPSDAATGVSVTPDLVFTGTDAEEDELEYEVQIAM